MTAALPVAHSGIRTAATTIALVGIHGYGTRHLAHLRTLQSRGEAELVALADRRPPSSADDGPEIPFFDSLTAILAAGIRPDIVIVSTPIHTHEALAREAMAAGADVYVEKPPVTSLAQFDQLVADAAAAGRSIQTGFQSLGSEGFRIVEEIVASGEIGDVLSVGAVGSWMRTDGYFRRSAWAGKRVLDGLDVMDGVVTNPLAHAVVGALRAGGAILRDDVASIDTELFRAHNIDCDDTSVVRVHTVSGRTITCALTLCAPERSEPVIRLIGSAGQIDFLYALDEVVVTTAAGIRRQVGERTNLLDNLIRHRATGEPLLSPIEASGAFMRVLEAIRLAPAPTPIGDQHIEWIGDGDDRHPLLPGIEAQLDRAVAEQKSFSELGLPWAVR